MIYSFSVKNFLSIAEGQTVSFASTSDKTMRDVLTVEVKPGCFINKLCIFYGANAAGKTNLLFAFKALFSLLTTCSLAKSDAMAYTPFALKKGEPTEFRIVFFMNGVQFDYEVSYDASRVISETMSYYPQGVKALFYKRSFKDEDIQPEIEFGGTLKLLAKTKDAIRNNTYNNHSVLSTFGKLSLTDDALPFAELYNKLDVRLHHDLLVHYLSVLLCNSESSQLFITNHAPMLLDEEFIRRDMIYLADKDKETASTEFTRVSDMGLHKNLSLFNAYQIGRLGAKPEIGSTYLSFNKDSQQG